ncbi:DUF6773 family protein [Clostridium drakei]|uniref:Uncharacterized protein n=1 Tax=Clostridium drakei TaxID=332101 RepID=A0A2U8DR73_9CLOT|nr:DUF6773 family protein [Clostridium drakei]AWI05140.1 hypothetical protein B9W14_11720 [Clostridium drakei]
MKSNIIQDERVIAEKRKIISETFTFVMIFLIGSTLVKQFIFKASFSEYAIEFIAFFGASFYIMIRNILIGNSPFGIDNHRKNRMIIINSVVIGLTNTVVSEFLNFKRNGISLSIMDLIIIFIISILEVFAISFVLNILSKRRSEKLENKFDDDIKE